MKLKTQFIIATVYLLIGGSAYSFFIPLTWKEKTEKADLIVRGVVVDIIYLSNRRPEVSSDKDRAEIFPPYFVAVFRVTDVIKRSEGRMESTIFIPCGYPFDESPSELSNSHEYVLFLRSMGANYFHPLDGSCTHRMKLGQVAEGGFDHAIEDEFGGARTKTLSYKQFLSRIAEFLKDE